jgi:biopolymer transport protein ExbD
MSHRKKHAYEPPAVLLTDLAFNLVIFFVVCASTDSDLKTGRKQDIPRGTKDASAAATSEKNMDVHLTRNSIEFNGVPTALADLRAKLEPRLAGKTRAEDRMVILKCRTKDVTYQQWIRVTTLIEQAGGIVALQLEEDQEVIVK